DRKHRCGAFLGCQEAAHSLEAAVRIRGRLGYEPRVEWQARRFQRRLIALTPFTRGRDLVFLDDHADVPMAELDQMLDQPPGAADAVAEDRVAVDPGDRAVDQHERDPESRKPGQVRLRLVADR